MKFFLVISIIALWWVPMNSPGNIGISSFVLSRESLPASENVVQTSGSEKNFTTRRKMDHFDFQSRKQLL